MSLAPVLFTPASYSFEGDHAISSSHKSKKLSDEQLRFTYEIERTIAQIKKSGYRKVALQFPDNLLHHGSSVFDALTYGLRLEANAEVKADEDASGEDPVVQTRSLTLSEPVVTPKLFILGDTSYGACCVDEVAAEHVDADAIVHYGRACLSPTSRLPVIYVFTRQPLDRLDDLFENFQTTYPEKDQKIVVMADVTYQYQLHGIVSYLRDRGYNKLFEADVQHDPSSPLPNRTVPEDVLLEPSRLKEWSLFHISEPPEALLLTLSSRVANIHVCTTNSSISSQIPSAVSSVRALSRRYALILSVSTVSIFGILINTLSVKNYLHIVEHVKNAISAAGKKSYTFVVGKVNAAKVANFGEIGAWVVIGCWESSLIDSKDFWKPIVTPYELELALQRDDERLWTGQWRSNYNELLNNPQQDQLDSNNSEEPMGNQSGDQESRDFDSGSESSPPEFDLRSGAYVSHTRPMQSKTRDPRGPINHSTALQKRSKGELIQVAGEASPGAEYLQTKRSWKGLGSDFDSTHEESSTAIDQGTSGIARGYVHKESESKV